MQEMKQLPTVDPMISAINELIVQVEVLKAQMAGIHETYATNEHVAFIHDDIDQQLSQIRMKAAGK